MWSYPLFDLRSYSHLHIDHIHNFVILRLYMSSVLMRGEGVSGRELLVR